MIYLKVSGFLHWNIIWIFYIRFYQIRCISIRYSEIFLNSGNGKLINCIHRGASDYINICCILSKIVMYARWVNLKQKSRKMDSRKSIKTSCSAVLRWKFQIRCSFWGQWGPWKCWNDSKLGTLFMSHTVHGYILYYPDCTSLSIILSETRHVSLHFGWRLNMKGQAKYTHALIEPNWLSNVQQSFGFIFLT